MSEIDNNRDVQDLLSSVGVNGEDLFDLFRTMDIDGSGSLDFEEFTFNLFYMIYHVDKTTIFYAHKNIEKLIAMQEEMSQHIVRIEDAIAEVAVREDRKSGPSGSGLSCCTEHNDQSRLA